MRLWWERKKRGGEDAAWICPIVACPFSCTEHQGCSIIKSSTHCLWAVKYTNPNPSLSHMLTGRYDDANFQPLLVKPAVKTYSEWVWLNKLYGKRCGKCESSSQSRCVCVCAWLEQSEAPTGVPHLHLLCDCSQEGLQGESGGTWQGVVWKSCPHAVLMTHSQLLLTRSE